jgi:hypothetical protein
MNFLRAIIASLLSLICTLAVSTFVTLQTLNTTVLDRGEVKTWLDKSGMYNNLLTTTLDNNAAAQQELSSGSSSIVSADDLKKALGQTFNASYVKQATEKAIDSTYNWLDGNASTISFEINTTDKKADFTNNLSAILEPQLAQLPRCASVAQFQSNNPPCLPAGTTPKQAADELATDAANQANIFQQPVTSQTVAESSPKQSSSSLTDNSTAQQARRIVSDLKNWLLWLPIIAVVSGALMVLLSQHRLKAAKHLAGRLTVGLVITCLAGLLIANVGSTLSLTGTATAQTNDQVTLKNIVEPVIHQAAPAIGNRLALVSGLLALVTFTLWIILRVIKKRRERADLLKPAEADHKAMAQPAPTTGDAPKPSQTSAPNAPQSQPAPTSSKPDEQK